MTKKEQVDLQDPSHLAAYQEEYDEKSFWHKIKKYSKKVGGTGIYVVFLLYYTFRKPDLPLKVRTTILGALGYFVMPIDIIPDLTPFIGYTDDMVALMGALMMVAAYIDDQSKEMARAKVEQLFGESMLEDLKPIDTKLAKKQESL
ncbi:YkvA family protein [Alkalicoccobacillus murimartini]|uniref:Uncharacterized membrane protein YkvA (DUF1232 family) n=1 Tax=Alkalicoccobacillus murimartini TaxID=171685 RepID=A0ABT9YGS7_9BACI|nr:YkvA family protein [Alkalicoccobacillus murimartini]MDQ0206904.1 uncharacterized membrane protein YkvA (DUF1232 family) [Alkalicoccobacillus murimartini]